MASSVSDTFPADVEKLKVADLKRELKTRGLSTTGNKSELIERLQEHLQAEPGYDDVNEDDVLKEEDEELTDDVKDDIVLDASLPEDAILGAITNTESVTLKKESNNLTQNHVTVVPSRNVTATTTLSASAKKDDTNVLLPASTAKLKLVQAMSSQECMEMRSKRFNMPLGGDAKKEARAKRFGIVVGGQTGAKKTETDLMKLKQRADRFGVTVSPSFKKNEEEERILKRKERFGALIAGSIAVDGEAKKKRRAERFGIV